MKTLVVLENAGSSVRESSLSAITFARSIASESEGSVTSLLLGCGLGDAAAHASEFSNLITADHECLTHPLADRWAAVIAKVVDANDIDLLVGVSNTLSKDVIARAGGLLGGAMASDVVGHAWSHGQLQLQRPMYAGTVIGTVVLKGNPMIITIRSSAYDAATPSGEKHEITPFGVELDSVSSESEFEGLNSKESTRPDVTEARVVVSGGRALKNSDDFEEIVGGLADAMVGATGSSRALVDAGITPNELQVGQTGKIVAPDLYVALGISGAVQHLAGMKNSKVIVAINTDADAPIFDVADYGLVGDVYEVVPEMIRKLNAE